MVLKIYKIFFILSILFLLLFYVSLCISPIQQLLLIFFQNNILHREFRNPFIWIPRIKLIVKLALLPLFTAVFLLFTKKGSEIKKDILKESSVFIAFIKSKYSHLPTILIIFTLAFFKLITTDYKYADDIRRSSTGALEWMWHECRYITQIFSQVLHVSTGRLVDISYFAQVFAICILIITTFAILFLSEKQISSATETLKRLPPPLYFYLV